MSYMQVTDKLFRYPSSARVVRYNDYVDPHFGCEPVEITQEQFDQLNYGQMLYITVGDELTVLIRKKQG